MKERYLQLIDACRNDEELLAFITNSAANFLGYVSEVYRTDLQRPVDQILLSGDDLRDALTRLDNSRHVCHEAAIASVRQLNRLCERHGLPLLFEGDITNRYEIADFCMAFVKDVFDARVL